MTDEKDDARSPLNLPAEVRVPADAGEYADGLLAILRRIPDGWGRWITIGRGWYPIVVELDRAIAALHPDYEVNQVKQKFGTLRYYCQWSGTPEVAGLIRDAETQSGRTCEVCGSTDDTVTTGATGPTDMEWITTRCAACRTKPTRMGEF